MALQNTSNSLRIEQLATLLAAFVDVLLPGGDRWPSASQVGAQHAVLMRLFSKQGEAMLVSIAEILMAHKAPYEGLSADQRINAVAALEADQPAVFALLKGMTNYAYYESPAVVAAIDARGIPYRLTPHRDGYFIPAFEASQTPKHHRGRFLTTDDITPVDASHLELEQKTTERWGLRR
ncbi:gluconate 2-dehydrogenase subunit 3 family protein [Mesorhizobium sp. CO1-1-8]|uniref:gluconate 2-dehydrogenase subunit 3 family protein n=1 Tax=Mesorhizobium sp. CO1-1-8 TaxID=2876631 RepID=UPI001CD0DC0D|nr:gluconate 2-dehydrogenase subunit 3 family protein [Mesorhizobium sp. CO1-1-8]MBZ9772249.1 gluconate 2-dehydrogenase subunit 3 family protein [Mesorhizobium sp. CO1-1-8]